MAALDALPDLSDVSTVQGFSAVLVSSILIAYLAFMLIVLHWIIAYFTMDSKTPGDVSKSHDRPIIENGWTHKQVLSSVDTSNDDLAKDLRQQGVERPEVERPGARLERRGKLYVIKN